MNTAQYMPQIAFDTLAYANKLKAVGVEPKIAETQAELHASVLSELINNQVATKKDLATLEFSLKLEMNKLLIKLGSITVACTTVLGTLITISSHFH